MAFYSGTANSLDDLVLAIQNACVTEGWTLQGNVLSKGACFTQITSNSNGVYIRGGTGVDGSNALTGATRASSRMGRSGNQAGSNTFTFPMDYYIHVLTDPDEVYFLVNFEVSKWSWIAFGLSPVAGVSGTGGWYGGQNQYIAEYGGYYITSTTGGASNANTNCPALFWSTVGNRNNGSYIHHDLDGVGWSGEYWGNSVGAGARGWPYLTQNNVSPNSWNEETLLVPIVVCVGRGSSLYSAVGQIAHARYARNDNYADGEIITIGEDRWRIYPWYLKNAAARDGGNGPNHSGTLGWAIRYDGE